MKLNNFSYFLITPLKVLSVCSALALSTFSDSTRVHAQGDSSSNNLASGALISKEKQDPEAFFNKIEQHLACHNIFDVVYQEGSRLVVDLLENRASSDTTKSEELRGLEIFRNKIRERLPSNPSKNGSTSANSSPQNSGIPSPPSPNLAAPDAELSEHVQRIYALFTQEILGKLRSTDFKNRNEIQTALTALFESESIPGDFSERLGLAVDHLQRRSEELALTCADLSSLRRANLEIKEAFEDSYQRFERVPSPSELQSQSHMEPKSALFDRIVRGAYNAFANLYQRCEVLSTPVVDGNLMIPGIVVTGNHPAGGKRRNISRKNGLPLPEFFAKHPYLKDYEAFYKSKGEALGCSKLHENPPIYDFGGKANASSGLMDHFSNSGSGTSVLGVDCSGFVVSAMASSGSRLKKNVPLNPASLLSNTGASSFRSPNSNSLTCLSTYNIQRAEKTILTLQPGDILASTGHVVIVEWMGPDAFGLDTFTSVNDCTSSKMDAKKFKIRILHSAPENNGIGVARHDLAQFTNATYAAAFKELALKTCKAKFQSGYSSVSTTASGVNAVRFTAASGCTESSKEFTRSRCVSQCLYKF